jgi:hypothetical protein
MKILRPGLLSPGVWFRRSEIELEPCVKAIVQDGICKELGRSTEDKLVEVIGLHCFLGLTSGMAAINNVYALHWREDYRANLSISCRMQFQKQQDRQR